MTMPDLPSQLAAIPSAYQARWSALSDRLAHIATAVRPTDELPERGRVDETRYALEALADVALSLRAFAQAHLEFFGTPRPSPAGYSVEHAAALAVYQVGADLEVLEKAAQQRLCPLGANDRAVLAITDKLARRALKRAKLAGLISPDATALTYFQKSPLIRVIPYAPVALIGIPYSASGLPQDYLSIPHEIGHYVYWNGRVAPQPETLAPNEPARPAAASTVRAWLRRQLPLWLHSHLVGGWIEETFADVYAALVAGPIAGNSLQDLLQRQGDDKLQVIDEADRHPTPVLRPYIYSQVMRRRGWRQAAKRLDDDWASRLQGRLIAAAGQVLPILASSGARGAVDALISVDPAGEPSADRPLDRLIGEIHTLLADVTVDEEWAGPLRGGKTVLTLDDEAVEELQAGYSHFEVRVRAVAEAAGRPAKVIGRTWSEWRRQINPELAREDWDADLADADWLTLARGEGWTEGPTDKWPTSG